MGLKLEFFKSRISVFALDVLYASPRSEMVVGFFFHSGVFKEQILNVSAHFL